MVFRRYEVTSLETLDNKEVWDLDLPTSGMLSAIHVMIRATNGSTSNKEDWPHLLVDDVSIKDGSKVFHSLTGGLVQGLAALDTKKLPQDFYTEIAGLYQRGYFPVLLGRRLRDPSYGLDLGKLKNPKLFVDWNIEAVGAIAATTYATNSGRISVVLEIDDEPPVMPTSYIRKTVIEKFTQATSGDKTVHLPVDYPYRAIIVQPLIADYEVHSLITKAKLNFDNGKFVPFEEQLNEYMRFMAWAHGWEWEAAIELAAAGGDQKMLPDTNIRSFIPMKAGGATMSHFEISGGAAGNPTIYSFDAAGTARTTADAWQCLYRTNAPRHCIYIPFGSPLLEENFLEAQKYGKADLVLTQAGAASTCRVALEEIAPN